MTESEIWQIIQAGNEISVMRIQVFITITVGVLIISSVRAVTLNVALLLLLLGSYVVFGFVNFSMTIGEMEILLRGMQQLSAMHESSKEISLMGQYLVEQLNEPLSGLLVPILYGAYWIVTLGTVSYSIWQYLKFGRSKGSTNASDAIH